MRDVIDARLPDTFENNNDAAKPYLWTAPAKDIIAKVQRARAQKLLTGRSTTTASCVLAAWDSPRDSLQSGIALPPDLRTGFRKAVSDIALLINSIVMTPTAHS